MMNLCAMKQPFKHWTIIFLKHLKSLEILFFKIFIVIQLQLYAFSPHPSTPPQVNPPLSPLVLSMCPL